MRKPSLAGSALALLIALGACGGGGSDGHIAYIPPPPSPPADIPDPATTPSPADFDTAEYNKSSAALANGLPAYEAGASGNGVKVGVVDTGIVPGLAEFSGRIDPASKDVAGSRPMDDPSGHGTAVASIIAAAKDDAGIHGVAYGATIVMIRADRPGSCPQSCSFSSDDIAKGVDAARQAGAKVLNLSIGGNGNDAILEAIKRAAAAGIIVVIAAGNDTSAAPSLFAQRAAAVAPQHVVIVGALGALNGSGGANYDLLLEYSNQAGAFGARYLAAPGVVKILQLNGSIGGVAGTSFSAPVARSPCWQRRFRT